MKKISLLVLLSIFVYSGYSKQIDENTARFVAKTFFNNVLNKTDIILTDLTLADKNIEYKTQIKSNSIEAVYFYVFNLNKYKGFIIISGDDNVEPILAYSTEGNYDSINPSPEFLYWLDGYKEQIKYVLEHKVNATQDIAGKWSKLINGTYSLEKSKKKGGVAPLIRTKWNQRPYYNALCPGGSVTGCVATAMAQIMKYWNYPKTGTGFHSYKHQTYGTLSADFGSTTYNWTSMPDKVTSSNNAVATLMFQCGVSVDMDYSPDGSNAYVIISDNPVCAENSYKTYFGYDATTIKGLKRTDYTDADWKNLLKKELDNNRPVQYAGFGSGGGHTFVCDGYDTNDYFNMNWGWGGIADGYFKLDALNPTQLGTGAGLGSYNSNQEAVIGIKPLITNVSSDLELFSEITITPNPINFLQSFTVYTDLLNAGSTDFKGDYCAALFDESGTFIDYVQILTTGDNALPPNYHYTNGVTFSSAGVLAAPGHYTIGIYYRLTDGDWILADESTFTNPVSININSPYNDITLYSNINPTPSTFVQGQAASVDANFINNGTDKFYGIYLAALYDLSGNFVETIDYYEETNGLPSGFVYKTPITFSTPAISAPPGTYLLSFIDSISNNNGWYWLGGTSSYLNPVKINVIAPNINPDIFETNNTQATAYTLPLNWVNNKANPKTTGSNIHIGSDLDYYKINLSNGYNYTITARVDDNLSSDNGNTYTSNVIWSYNPGNRWSESYNDVKQGNILFKGGGTVTFLIAPFFEGLTGTYLLDIHITRISNVGITNFSENNGQIQIYPNPAKEKINIKYDTGRNIKDETISIYNLHGQLILQMPIQQKQFEINISNFAKGVYIVKLSNSENVIIRRFVKY